MKARSKKLMPVSITAAVMCSTLRLAPAHAQSARSTIPGWEQVGQASFYNSKYAGHRTADGTRYDPGAMTAAHQSLPLGTRLMVMREDSDRAVVVTVTDRQAHVGRILDLSRGAAEQLGMIGRGTTRVRLIAISPIGPSSADALPEQPTRPREDFFGHGISRRHGLSYVKSRRGGRVAYPHVAMRVNHAVAMIDHQRRLTARHHPTTHVI